VQRNTGLQIDFNVCRLLIACVHSCTMRTIVLAVYRGENGSRPADDVLLVVLLQRLWRRGYYCSNRVLLS